MRALWIVALLVTPSVVLGQDAGFPDAGPIPSEIPLADLDALYERRDQPGVIKELDTKLSAALKKSPTDFALLWRSARAHFWIADGANDDRLKKSEGKQSWDLGEKAIRANPNAVEGHYWASAGLGSYSQAVGVLTALTQGLEGTFNEKVDRAIKLNPDYDHGGPLLTKGRYHFELPWPKRDFTKAQEYFAQVEKAHPENLRKKLFLAELLWKNGDAKAALAEISKVAGADVSYDPPEGRRIQTRAQTMKIQIEKELK
ncbi:MAG: tetratricopeptide repeat protein [Myxococcaceae bacterium]